MMKKNLIRTAILFSAIVMASLSGCKKDEEEDKDTSAAQENAVADAAFNDAANIADEAATGSVSSYRNAGTERVYTSCATVTLDTVSVPHVITIDFGTSNCLGNDGNYRRGKILVSYSGHYRDSGSTHTITFDQYFVNDNQIQGTKSVTNNGRNSAGNLSFTISVNGSITWSTGFGGGTSTHTANRTREWIAGESTAPWNDDIYLISGSSSGTTRSGSTYSCIITSPLKKEIGWRHFTEGVMEFTPGNKPTRTIDFGYVNGARDLLATVTINGNTYVITLR